MRPAGNQFSSRMKNAEGKEKKKKWVKKVKQRQQKLWRHRIGKSHLIESAIRMSKKGGTG